MEDIKLNQAESGTRDTSTYNFLSSIPSFLWERFPSFYFQVYSGPNQGKSVKMIAIQDI